MVVERNLLRAFFAKPFQMISKLMSYLKSRKTDNAIEDDLEEIEEDSEKLRNTRDEFLEGLKVEEQDLNEIVENRDETQSKEKEIE